ncbi:MAG: GNAT family N-acetyltransferase [Chloroflexi bacterium]|nr:MAG: GNAT family N-acetyltransferase [Chloroflexota bacterium]
MAVRGGCPPGSPWCRSRGSTGRLDPRWGRPDDTAVLESLFVSPDHRDRGLARQLLRAAAATGISPIDELNPVDR